MALPYFAVLFAILQTCLLLFAQQVLQSAVTQAARLIMTGQVQASNLSAGQFQQRVCSDAAVLFTCTGIYVNVQKFSSFSNMTMLNPLQNGNFNSNAMNYVPGATGDIVLVQAFYQWPVALAPLGFNLANMNGNNRLMIATAVFRNEPF